MVHIMQEIHSSNSIFFLFLLYVRLLACSTVVAAGQEDMYTNNYGLASAVAGDNFFVLATDTRLAGSSGYDILERFHVQSRLWSVATADTKDSMPSNADDGSFIGPDGSLQALSSTRSTSMSTLTAISSPTPLTLVASYTSSEPNTWIASVGCQSDCEHLKRYLRARIRAANYFGEAPGSISSDTTAVALSNLLYTRRFFPFYSFCLVGGFCGKKGEGQVYAYDAIGSYQAVATACAGSGQSQMQPILDRVFQTAQDGVHPPSSRVSCATPEKAVECLLRAYRAVSERDITVGDNVVFCSVRRTANGDEYSYETKIFTAPLKQH